MAVPALFPSTSLQTYCLNSRLYKKGAWSAVVRGRGYDNTRWRTEGMMGGRQSYWPLLGGEEKEEEGGGAKKE